MTANNRLNHVCDRRLRLLCSLSWLDHLEAQNRPQLDNSADDEYLTLTSDVFQTESPVVHVGAVLFCEWRKRPRRGIIAGAERTCRTHEMLGMTV
ncbi:hypothetical protein BDZ85DRAFT_268032 [Elsinoe ampelina]|uniref:Uncharacterized protein n=1 Tax=Elsinoe ampelina TaxID=302913 RepID=A0A6A6G2W1_9PEZI|nr:hypothetical protein BDZ85DRAFT_268032 [Elsinoe ampelina]